MNKDSFLAQIAPAAQANMRELGILASVTLAQAILESGWRSHAPGNNLFGIKGSGQLVATQEFIIGRWLQIVDGFCVYCMSWTTDWPAKSCSTQDAQPIRYMRTN